MKPAKKIALIISVILIVSGLIVSLLTWAAIGFDYTRLSDVNFVTKTYTADRPFSNIHIEGAECDIRLMPSENDKCSISYPEGDKISHAVTVENDTLRIKRTDNRKWYEHIEFYPDKTEIVVYLPDSEYGVLYAKTLSGDIDISIVNQ